MESLLGLKVRDVEESYRKLPACKVRSLVRPGRLHPQYSALREEGEAWAEARIAPVLSKAAMEKLRSTNCVALACYLWPHAEGARALTFVKFAYWVVLFDDVADDPLAMGGDTERLRCFCSHFLHAMFGDGVMHAAGAGGFNEQELLTVDLGREWWSDVTQSDATARMPPGLQARVAEAMRAYVLAQPPCAELRAEWEAWLRGPAARGVAPPCTLEELRLQWRVASGSYLAIALTEYDVGVELEEETLTSPLLQQLINSIGDQWNWVNNIFSFPKDVLKHETLNFLTLLHLQGSSTSRPSSSFQVTLAQAWDIAAQLERDCNDLAVRIAQHESATPAAQKYADALCTSLASHLMWFAHTTRYPHTNSGPRQSAAPEDAHPATCDRDIQIMA